MYVHILYFGSLFGSASIGQLARTARVTDDLLLNTHHPSLLTPHFPRCCRDRIVFGSDFPNLPYPYEEERDALWLRDLPLPVYRKIFHDNAARLLGIA